jgi:N6-adenosine-specific RNA methylase IME4
MIDFPDKKYKIIYADPPWFYKDPKQNRGGATRHYSTMKKADIEALPVKDIAEDDSVLFLWTTMPKLLESFDLMKAWGFEYKTCAFVWVKRNKISPSWFWGMGSWTRANAELCLLAVRGGGVQRLSASVHSVIDEPIERHSKKPNLVRDKIVELVGDLPRIELFARESADGWDVWGNEVC